jgi:hypothetical protein
LATTTSVATSRFRSTLDPLLHELLEAAVPTDAEQRDVRRRSREHDDRTGDHDGHQHGEAGGESGQPSP